jgi:hypothetical protein
LRFNPAPLDNNPYFKMFWTPAFAGVTFQETFYETINFPATDLRALPGDGSWICSAIFPA